MRTTFSAFWAAVALAATASLSANPAQALPSEEMTVAAFMDRVAQLRQIGPDWPLSPEAGELFAVISSVGAAYRQELRNRTAAGQPVEACLPAEAEIGSDILLNHLAAYPASEARQTSIRAAFAELVRARFPCS